MIYPFYVFSILAIRLLGLIIPVSTASILPEKIGIVETFIQLPSEPLAIPLRSDVPFSEEGGHIQGIQLFREEKGFTAFLAGSSNDVAYIAQVSLHKEAQVRRIDTLMLSPYRHAGGFQIYDRFLAVGIEDNRLRTRSKVLIYEVGINTNWKKPLYTLERNGPFERSTAGAVGIAKYKNEIILVVADWNARNLDFYSCPVLLFEKKEGHFSQIGSLEIASLAKSTWSDSAWHPYQNINLIADKSGFYAMAFGRDVHDNHVADLFSITMNASSENKFSSPVETRSMSNSETMVSVQAFFPREISLEKISSRNFPSREGADFRAGAGIYHSQEGLILSAAPYLMNGESFLNFFAYPTEMLYHTPPPSQTNEE